MKTFKVIRSWTGYSEITVQAKNEEQANLLVEEGEYDTDNEVSTGNGLDYGYENEEIIDIQETKMNRVIIELEFDDKPTDADVYNYLNELMDNDCLGYEIKENEDVR
jgi:hypothetical protein